MQNWPKKTQVPARIADAVPLRVDLKFLANIFVPVFASFAGGNFHQERSLGVYEVIPRDVLRYVARESGPRDAHCEAGFHTAWRQR